MNIYHIIRNIAELAYFIILSGVMAYYAKKSYDLNVEKKSELITDIYIDYKDRLERGQSGYPIYLEIYNNGNDVARNVKITVDEITLVESISIFNNNLGFVQSQQTKYIPIGSLFLYIDGINDIIIFNNIINYKEIKNYQFKLQYDNKKELNLNLDLDYLMQMPRTPVGKSSEESEQSKELSEIKSINKNLYSINRNIKDLGDIIKKKK